MPGGFPRRACRELAGMRVPGQRSGSGAFLPLGKAFAPYGKTKVKKDDSAQLPAA